MSDQSLLGAHSPASHLKMDPLLNCTCGTNVCFAAAQVFETTTTTTKKASKEKVGKKKKTQMKTDMQGIATNLRPFQRTFFLPLQTGNQLVVLWGL